MTTFPMELQLLFTAEKLQLNPLLSKGAVREGRFTVKSLDTGGYLTIDGLQWQALTAFAQPKTVPEVLRNLIAERKCPALHDFYELIVKAQRASVLQVSPSPVQQPVPVGWRFNLVPRVACRLGGALLVVGLLAIMIWPPCLPGGNWLGIIYTILAGYLGAAAMVSLGNVLGASVLHAAGGDAYRPRLSWFWLLPHFSLDLRDVQLVDARAQLGMELIRPAPLGLLVAVLCLWWPQAALLPALLFALKVRPCFGGAICRAITIYWGKPVLDTSSHMLFPANRNWAGLWRTTRLQFDWRVVTARLVWSLLWVGGITTLGSWIAGVAVSELIFDWHFWKIFGVVYAITMAIPAGVFACVAAMESMRQPLLAAKKYWRVRRQRLRALDQPCTMKTITSTLAISSVCQQLPLDRRRVLAEQVIVVTFPRGSMLADFSQPADHIHLIVSGAIDVYRRTPKGRAHRVWRAIEGDVVGAETLVEPHPLGWRLKARGPVIALRLPREVFVNEIVARLGTVASQALIHRVPFLRQNPLCRNWHPQAITRFASISRMVTFANGGYVLIESHESQGLFFIYEGEAQVVRGNRRISRLRYGGFIGEIGLLQYSASTASVIADGPLSCLAIDKMVFFRFLTQNYEVALEVERLSSQRLGKPVFPLEGTSFEVY
jgi:CRP-like cAMP-binding protein